jgi:hypothetical protein
MGQGTKIPVYGRKISLSEAQTEHDYALPREREKLLVTEAN